MKDKKGEKQDGEQIEKHRREKTTRFFVLKKAAEICFEKATRFYFEKAREFCFEKETFCAGSFALVLKTIETFFNLSVQCQPQLRRLKFTGKAN